LSRGETNTDHKEESSRKIPRQKQVVDILNELNVEETPGVKKNQDRAHHSFKRNSLVLDHDASYLKRIAATRKKGPGRKHSQRKKDRSDDEVIISCDDQCCKTDTTREKCRSGNDNVYIINQGSNKHNMKYKSLHWFWGDVDGFEWCCGGDCGHRSFMSNGPFNLIAVNWSNDYVTFTGFQCEGYSKNDSHALSLSGNVKHWPENVVDDPITLTAEEDEDFRKKLQENEDDFYSSDQISHALGKYEQEASGKTMIDLSKCTEVGTTKDWCDRRSECNANFNQYDCNAPDLRVMDEQRNFIKIPYDNTADDEDGAESSYMNIFRFEHHRNHIDWWCGSKEISRFNDSFNVLQLETSIGIKGTYYALVAISLSMSLMTGMRNPVKLAKSVKTLVQLGKVIQKVAPKAIKKADRVRNKWNKEQERKQTYFSGRLKWAAYNCPATAFTVFENAPSATCKDDDVGCPAFAEAGGCIIHPSIGLEHCKFSCKRCYENAPSATCKDDVDSCPAFAEAGGCISHPSSVKHCKLSCNACAERKERLVRKNWRQQDRKEHFFRKNGQYNDPKTVEFKPPKIVATKGSSHYE